MRGTHAGRQRASESSGSMGETKTQGVCLRTSDTPPRKQGGCSAVGAAHLKHRVTVHGGGHRLASHWAIARGLRRQYRLLLGREADREEARQHWGGDPGKATAACQKGSLAGRKGAWPAKKVAWPKHLQPKRVLGRNTCSAKKGVPDAHLLGQGEKGGDRGLASGRQHAVDDLLHGRVSVSVPQHEEPRHFRAFDGAVKCAERKSARGVLRVDPALM